MPERHNRNRHFCDATRFEGVLGMLRELSAAVARHAEAGTRQAPDPIAAAILGTTFSLLSAWSAVTLLARVKLDEVEYLYRTWS